MTTPGSSRSTAGRAYDDPEWVADAAAGVLANVYGYECFYDDIAELVTRAAGSTP